LFNQKKIDISLYHVTKRSLIIESNSGIAKDIGGKLVSARIGSVNALPLILPMCAYLSFSLA
jgi:hypothetical protein